MSLAGSGGVPLTFWAACSVRCAVASASCAARVACASRRAARLTRMACCISSNATLSLARLRAMAALDIGQIMTPISAGSGPDDVCGTHQPVGGGVGYLSPGPMLHMMGASSAAVSRNHHPRVRWFSW